MEMSTIPENQNKTSPTVKRRCGSSIRKTQKNLKKTRRPRSFPERIRDY
jgi:hypothetical protein